jgi:hypothetical protein
MAQRPESPDDVEYDLEKFLTLVDRWLGHIRRGNDILVLIGNPGIEFGVSFNLLGTSLGLLI